MILENIRHKGFAGIVIVIIFFAFSGFGNGDDFLNEIASVKSSIANNSSDDLQGWESLDPEKDEYEGVRTKAFYKYLETLPFVPERKEVVVAVIDSGFDIEHPDLTFLLHS